MRVEICLLLFFTGCKPPEEPSAPSFSCETACENLRYLGCEEAQRTPEGSSCEEVCENSFTVGIPAFEWDVEQATTTEVCEDGG